MGRWEMGPWVSVLRQLLLCKALAMLDVGSVARTGVTMQGGLAGGRRLRAGQPGPQESHVLFAPLPCPLIPQGGPLYRS